MIDTFIPFDLLIKRYRGSEPMKFVPYIGRHFDDSDENALHNMLFHEVYDKLQANSELHNMQLVNRYITKSALHPVLHCIIHGDRTYPVYRRMTSPLMYEPEQAQHVLADVNALLIEMHRHGLYHFDVCPRNIMVDDDNNFTLCEYGKLRTKETFITSPLMGSSLLAPVQIIQEMMSSKVEPDIIPYLSFKDKFIAFYARAANMISPMSFDILRTCENEVSGFIDVTLNRLCVIREEDDGSKSVVKTTQNLNPDEVDRFALAITLWRLFAGSEYITKWVQEVMLYGKASFVPVKKAIPIPIPVPISVPVPAPIVIPLPISETVPEPVPIPIPEPIPIPIPESVPIPIPIPEPIQEPLIEPDPVLIPVPDALQIGKRMYKYQGQERMVRTDDDGKEFILFKGQRIYI